MEQQDREKSGLFDFALDPTPSLKAYKQFTNHIHEYFSTFNSDDGGLSIGPILLGTPNSPFIKAPIEMDPREIERHLRPTSDILKSAIHEAMESIEWTRKILEQTGSKSPEAENRIQCLETFVDEISGLLDKYRGFAWHPQCYERIRERVQRSFTPGEPGIPVQITILV